MRERGRRNHVVLAVIALLGALCNGCSREDPSDLSFRAYAAIDAGRPLEAEAALAKLQRIRKLTVSEHLLRSRAASAEDESTRLSPRSTTPACPRKASKRHLSPLAAASWS